MTATYVPLHVKCRLWGLAAGRCQYRGCNEPLWLDDLTKEHLNTAYVAHIVADKPDGPRGDPVWSEKLRGELTNLMLLCDTHHRQVDRDELATHPVSRLQEMKAEHEDRIRLVGAVGMERRSEIVVYGANIGEHVRLPNFSEAASAMLPERYPARDRHTALSLVHAWHKDDEDDYWSVEAEHLRRAYKEEIRPGLRDPGGQHVSVFAVAPQPLLMLLGYLLGDLAPTDVYQLHREPPTWAWLPASVAPTFQNLVVEEPSDTTKRPALVLALSATIADDRVTAALGETASIWRVTIPQPNNDYLKVRGQLAELRETLRPLMDRIKARHGHGASLTVFPAAPVAACIEFGRIVMPKADLPLKVYDENRRRGGFVHALDLGNA